MQPVIKCLARVITGYSGFIHAKKQKQSDMLSMIDLSRSFFHFPHIFNINAFLNYEHECGTWTSIF